MGDILDQIMRHIHDPMCVPLREKLLLFGFLSNKFSLLTYRKLKRLKYVYFAM